MPTVKTIKVNYNMKLLASLCVVIMFLQCLRKEKKERVPLVAHVEVMEVTCQEMKAT